MSLAPLIGRSLAGEVRVPEHATDQLIIDAVLDELLVTPLEKLSLEDVARRAGVTRMTVYRRFGDRQRVIEATFAREVSSFLDALVAADDPGARPSDRISSAFATALTLTHSHRLVAHLLATRPADLLDAVLADDGFVISAGSAFIASHVESRATGEILARLFLALVLMPPPSVDLTDPGAARALARDVVVPVILRGPGD